MSIIAYLLEFLKEKTATSRQVKSLSEIPYLDVDSFPKLINTYGPFYRKQNKSQAITLDISMILINTLSTPANDPLYYEKSLQMERFFNTKYESVYDYFRVTSSRYRAAVSLPPRPKANPSPSDTANTIPMNSVCTSSSAI